MKRSKLIFACIAIIIILSSFFAIRGFGLSNYLKVVVPLMLIVTIIFTMLFMLKCLKWYTSYMMFSRKLFNSGYYGSNSASHFGRMMPLISVQFVPI